MESQEYASSASFTLQTSSDALQQRGPEEQKHYKLQAVVVTRLRHVALRRVFLQLKPSWRASVSLFFFIGNIIGNSSVALKKNNKKPANKKKPCGIPASFLFVYNAGTFIRACLSIPARYFHVGVLTV